MSKVLSITPALPGWFSVYKDGEETFELPVVLWALVEDDDNPALRWPTSYSVGGDTAEAMTSTDDEDANFTGYVYRAPR